MNMSMTIYYQQSATLFYELIFIQFQVSCITINKPGPLYICVCVCIKIFCTSERGNYANTGSAMLSIHLYSSIVHGYASTYIADIYRGCMQGIKRIYRAT